MLCLLSGCQAMPLNWKPTPILMETSAPEGASPLFNRAWKDGCETGIAMFGDNTQRTMFGFKIDPDYMMKPEYFRGWEMGSLYCRIYVYRHKKRSVIGE